MSEYANAFRGGASAESIFAQVTDETKHGPDRRRAEKWAKLRARLEHAQAYGEVHGWIPEWPFPDLPWSGVSAIALYLGMMNVETDLTYPRYWLISLGDSTVQKWHPLAPRRWHVLRCTAMLGWAPSAFDRGGFPRSYAPKGFSWKLPKFSRDPHGYEDRNAASRRVALAARGGWNANI